MMTKLRSYVTIGLLAAALALTALVPARAQLQIDVTEGVVEPVPVAITDFLSSDALAPNIAPGGYPTFAPVWPVRPDQQERFLERNL